jgi:hypothetical protein
MHTTAPHPYTAQPSVLPAIDVCLLMKWNYIAMGGKKKQDGDTSDMFSDVFDLSTP